MRVAIVLGGAACVWDDLTAAHELCSGIAVEFFVTNDMIAAFPEAAIGCTLHPYPQKLGIWLADRTERGWPPHKEIWSHLYKQGGFVTHQLNDWGGSSGLFAVQVALKQGFDRIVCCGVPMDADAGHIVRQKPWSEAKLFQPAWRNRRQQLIAASVRSLSGWTAELLGPPTRDWLLRPPDDRSRRAQAAQC